MKEVKIIKRYPNRKLYDMAKSCYVTLDEIGKMIKEGEDLKVIDNQTKADITALTLTQLLYESERKLKVQPPVELLREVICQGDGSFSGYIQTHNAEALKHLDTSLTHHEDSPSRIVSSGSPVLTV